MTPKHIEIDCTTHKIAADWYDNGADHTVLFIPGYTSTKQSYLPFVQGVMSKSNINACVVDLGGHGESPFDLMELTPAQNFIESITAFDWTLNNAPTSKVSVVGTSYGGYLAMQLAKYRNFNKLILRVPAMYEPHVFYTKWADMQEDAHATEYRKSQEKLAEHPLLRRKKTFKGRSYVMIHEDDEFIPLATTNAYIEALGAESHTARGFPHGLGDKPLTDEQLNDYQQVIADWLNS